MLFLSLASFATFLQSAVCLVGYISNNSLFPEPLNSEEEKKYLELLKAGDKKAKGILINSFDNSKGIKLSTYISRCVENEILMFLRSSKKLNSEVYLEDPIGKDKDDNTVTLQEVLENSDRNIEDEVDLKFKVKQLYEKMKEVLKSRERTILELRFGLGGQKPQTQNEIADSMGISRSYVSRIETKAIGKLAKEIKE